MNATCTAGIPQPQRVSDLGRLLKSEITAPLDFMPIKWCLLLFARQHLLGAFIICKVPSPALSLLARCFLITLCQLQGNSSRDTQSFVCLSIFEELQFSSLTWRFQRNVACSHLATRDDQFPHQDRRRALCVPFGTTQVEFSFDMQVLLPALLPIDRAPTRAPKFNATATHKPDDSAPRANQTTAHDETSRARRHEGRTAPCQSTARPLHRLARTADF